MLLLELINNLSFRILFHWRMVSTFCTNKYSCPYFDIWKWGVEELSEAMCWTSQSQTLFLVLPRRTASLQHCPPLGMAFHGPAET